MYRSVSQTASCCISGLSRGLPYSLDALLGIDTDNPPDKPTFTNGVEQCDREIVTHREFANVHGIEYSLNQLLRMSPSCSPGDMTVTAESDDGDPLPTKHGELEDASAKPDKHGNQAIVRDASVVLEMGVKPSESGSGIETIA
jgi:phosphatidylserine decarboxylase